MDKEVEIKEKQASWLNPGFAKQYLRKHPPRDKWIEFSLGVLELTAERLGKPNGLILLILSAIIVCWFQIRC